MRKFVGSEYGSLDAFALSEGEIPQPAQGEVRLKVEAAALGFVDGLIALGRYQIRPPLPYVPGGEIAGTVDATGPGVDAVVVGDRVVTWQLGGGLAEYVTVEAHAVDKIPAGLDATTAAAMLVDYQTAHYALFERGQLRQARPYWCWARRAEWVRLRSSSPRGQGLMLLPPPQPSGSERWLGNSVPPRRLTRAHLICGRTSRQLRRRARLT